MIADALIKMFVSRTIRTHVAHLTIYEIHEVLLIQVRDSPFYAVNDRE